MGGLILNRPRLSQLLLDAGLVTEDQIKNALLQQAHSGDLIGTILYRQKVLSEEQVVTYLSRVFEVPGILMKNVMP